MGSVKEWIDSMSGGEAEELLEVVVVVVVVVVMAVAVAVA